MCSLRVLLLFGFCAVVHVLLQYVVVVVFGFVLLLLFYVFVLVSSDVVLPWFSSMSWSFAPFAPALSVLQFWWWLFLLVLSIWSLVVWLDLWASL